MSVRFQQSSAQAPVMIVRLTRIKSHNPYNYLYVLHDLLVVSLSLSLTTHFLSLHCHTGLVAVPQTLQLKHRTALNLDCSSPRNLHGLLPNFLQVYAQMLCYR